MLIAIIRKTKYLGTPIKKNDFDYSYYIVSEFVMLKTIIVYQVLKVPKYPKKVITIKRMRKKILIKLFY